MATTYTVRVRDVWCGVRGVYEEECVTTDKREADAWYKQWKQEYSTANGYEGYKVTRTEKTE